MTFQAGVARAVEQHAGVFSVVEALDPRHQVGGWLWLGWTLCVGWKAAVETRHWSPLRQRFMRAI